MSLQDLFYIVAIVFMILVTTLIVLVTIAHYRLISKINQISELAHNLLEKTTDSSQRVFSQFESFFPKVIEAISIGELVKKFIERYQASKEKTQSKK